MKRQKRYHIITQLHKSNNTITSNLKIRKQA
jgi:hypothetical protein